MDSTNNILIVVFFIAQISDVDLVPDENIAIGVNLLNPKFQERSTSLPLKLYVKNAVRAW